MKDAEKAVAKVIAGLRSVEAASGLEGRVAEGVRRRMAERDAAGGRGGLFWIGWRWIAAGMVPVAVLLAVTMSAPRVQRRVVSVGVKATDGRAAGAGEMKEGSVAGLSESVPQRLKPRSGRLGGGVVQAVPIRQAASMASSQGTRAKDVALSFPAPPLPLTEQERLLLRVATLSGPKEVAALDRFGRGSQDAEEAAVFEKFFGRPETVEQTMQRINKGESQ